MVRTSQSVRHGIRAAKPYICWSCQQKRGVSHSVVKKQARAKEQWAAWAKEIKAGKRQTVLKNLEARGLVHDITGDRKALEKLLTEKRVGVYTGIDPTAASMHVGHMLPLMTLFWMYLQGCHTIALIGGATARIGDPTGRNTSRTPMTSTERKSNMVSIHYQVKKIWNNVEKVAKSYGWEDKEHHPEDWHRELINNNTWWNTATFVDVLKNIGSGMRLGTMLSRDTVKNKMENGDGMSFAEFSYPLLQAWDWWHMYSTKDIQMQIGGADQYGNIVAGVDAVKHMKKTHPNPDLRATNGVIPELQIPYGFTVPLLTTSSGEKFGKSAGNAIWLDEERTSLFDLYGFFVGTADADVERYLKFFTFMPLNEIQSIMARHKNNESKRVAQHRLAYDFVSTVHGKAAADRAKEQHMRFFQKKTISGILSDVQRDSFALAQTSEEMVESGKDPSASEIDGSNSPNPWTNHNSQRKREASTFQNRSLNPYAAVTTHNNAPTAHMVLPRGLIENQSIAKVLYSAGLVSSRSEGHRLAQSQGAYIGSRSGDQMSDDLRFVPAKLADPSQMWRSVIKDQEGDHAGMEKEGEEGLLILRVGKWKVKVIRVVTDDVFRGMVAEGQEAPKLWADLEAERGAYNWEQMAKEDSTGLSSEDWRYSSGVGKGPNDSGWIIHRGTPRARPVSQAIDNDEAEDFGEDDDDFEPHQKIKRGEYRREIVKGRQEGWAYLTSHENDPAGALEEDGSEEDWVKSMKRGNGALGDGAVQMQRGGRAKQAIFDMADDLSRRRRSTVPRR